MAGLTLTIITSEASSLNYGENVGNVSILKKLSLGTGEQITYVSDKALKYDIKRKGKEEKGWKLLDKKLKELVEKNLKGNELDVDSFGKTLVKEYEEFDLFGGLFTNIKVQNKKVKFSYGDSVKRTSPVKVTYAFSISPFRGDMNFLNNIDAYNRYIKYIEQEKEQAIAYSEEHKSHYLYTVTVDLDRVGVWEGEEKIYDELKPDEKAKRVKDLLDILMRLDRQIKGRWENLSPVFVIGGVFNTKHPFFMNFVDAKQVEERKLLLNVNKVLEAIELVLEDEREKITVGIVSGVFLNEDEIREKLKPVSVVQAFEKLKGEVESHYGGS
ncbi:type I-B CRISPR-associated protein Cas7/Cst2/DevR [Aquifex sp.]